MDNTSSYAAVEIMIRDGWFWRNMEKLERLLDVLRNKNLITATEHQALLELAKQLSGNPQVDQN